MRFSLATVVVAALVGTGLAAPLTARQQGSLVSDVGTLLGGVVQGVVVDVVALETQLTSLLGPIVAKIESVIHVTLAEKLVSLVQGVEGKVASTVNVNNIVQIVGEALAMVAQGVPLDAVNAYLKAATNGQFASLEAALGIANLAQVLAVVHV